MGRRLASVLLIAIAAVAIGTYSIHQHVAAATAEPLRVGILFPLTGDAAAWGIKGRKAIQLAVDDLNGSDACGRRVTTTVEDSAAQPNRGLSAFQKLVSVDRVPVVIGDIVSSVTLAVAPAAERTKTVLLSPTATAPAITNAGQYIYRIVPSDIIEGRVMAAYAAKRGFSRAAVLYMNNDYGLGIYNVFKDSFVTAQREIVLAESYLETNQDFRTALTKIRGLNPDVLYVAGYYADTAIIVRQARELGIRVQILGTTAIEEQKFLDIARDAAEGVVYHLATGYDATSSDPEVRRFVDNFQRRFSEVPGWIEAQTYDALGVVCNASRSLTGAVTGESMKAALDQLGTFKGVTGEFKFDQNGDVVKPTRLRTIRSGKFTNLEQ